MTTGETHRGLVYLVGAGPGDPHLVTVAAQQCLAAADVVFRDYLVHPSLLRYCRDDVEHHCLGGHREGRVWSQDEINQRVVAEAKQGRTVVRLKGGDPSIFGRGSEEAEYLLRHGVAFEVIPGVTAAVAAAAYAGIPLTHRDKASAVALITGQRQAGAADLDYRSLAHFPGTLVFYMGVTSANRWSQELIEAGKPPETSVALIRHVSLPTQQVFRCQLSDVAQLIEQQKLRPPILTIVGDVVDLPKGLDWFGCRPLLGQSVVVTRAADQAVETEDLFNALGAEVFLQPAIEISAVEGHQLTDVVERVQQFDWVVFSSANGVRYFCREVMRGGDVRRLGGCQIASIGPSTDAALHDFSLRSDLIPDKFVAEQLVAELSPRVDGCRVLLVRASRGREVLADGLSEAGAEVEQVVAYRSTDVVRPNLEIVERLRSGTLDWVTVTSSAIARSLVQLFGEDLRHAKLASISPVTSDTLRQLGFSPAAEATTFNMQGVADAIVSASSSPPSGRRQP